MPLVRLSSFLLMNIIYKMNSINVSMPLVGLSSFLRYPFRNPVFILISIPVFVNNSQNILKSNILSLFFWLVDFYMYIIQIFCLFVKHISSLNYTSSSIKNSPTHRCLFSYYYSLSTMVHSSAIFQLLHKSNFLTKRVSCTIQI